MYAFREMQSEKMHDGKFYLDLYIYIYWHNRDLVVNRKKKVHMIDSQLIRNLGATLFWLGGGVWNGGLLT